MNKNTRANKVIEAVKDIITNPYVIVIEIILVLLVANCIAEYRYYNKGTHRNCGGKWVYSEAVGHRNGTGYIYECDKCGEHHEFSIAYKDEE